MKMGPHEIDMEVVELGLQEQPGIIIEAAES